MIKKILGLVAILVVLFGVFYVVRTHNNVKNVMKYQQSVKDSLAKQGLQGDTQLALAIIYTETKGKVTDVMQSSESLTGKTNDISNKNASIDQGLSNLTTVLAYANSRGVDDWTGVQAYNFGKAYVDYIAKNGGKTTIQLAKTYSRDVVAPSLGNTTGAEYYHLTTDSIRYNGGKLYVNGGNMFYADEVRWHMVLLQLFNW